MEKLVLIDGNSLINRAFYAMPLLTTKSGIYTNAVYGFLNMFFKVLSDEQPSHAAVAFDLKAPTFRHKLFTEYKGTRKPLLKELLSLMGIKTFEKEGSEADDIIGTIAKHTSIKTIIITGDKDSFQLVDNETEVHFTKRGITDIEVYNNANFTEKTSLSPAQIIDLKALMGDSSDNIPGVPGIGEKTAKALLLEYGNIENLYSNTDNLKGKLQEKIVNNKELCYISKTLATIDCNCGVDTDLKNMEIPARFSLKAKERFTELEFKSLYKKSELFEDGEPLAPEKETIKKDITSVTIEDFAVLNKISATNISLTIGSRNINLSDGDTEYIINVRETLLDDGFNLSDALKALKPLLTGDKTLIVFSKKELKHFVKNNANITLTAPCEDVSLLRYLAEFSGREETLLDILTEYDLSALTPASSLMEIYGELKVKLKEEGLENLYSNVELPLTDLLYDMEVSGFKVDYNALSEAGEKYRVMLLDLESKIRDFANDDSLNVNSPKQLGELLFEKLKIGKGKKTKTGYSTTAEILETLEDAHPIVPLILTYRRIQKLQSTYIEGFKPLIDKKTGLIHTSFNQTVTATGRLSSKEPNLQNIPVRDDEGKELRKFFVPKSSDRILISADYSQIELRLLAAFSDCKALIDAFNNEKDVHASTAAKVFGVDINDVTPTMRSNAKAVNFGIIYGISEYGLAKNLKISNAKAREYINSYFSEYPEVKKYMDENVASAKENGYAITLLGRKRYIKELFSSNYNLKSFGERVAMNMPLQGSSADIIKLAMLGVANRIKKENLKSELILQVHDELIIDAFIDEKEKIEKILVEEMEGAVKLSVKLTVGLGCGKTWFDAK